MGELTTRPATAEDVPAVQRLVATCEQDLDGRVAVTLDAVAADLTRPGLDLARDTLLVFDGSGELAGRAWVHLGRRAEVDVHPDQRGRGLGTRLLSWVEARARELGSERLGQNVADADRAAAGLLEAHGYEDRGSSWLLEIALTGEPVVPALPDGITIRPFRPGDEDATYRLTEDAFNEWPERRPRGYDEWARYNIDRPAFAPAFSPLAFDGDRLVGAVLSLDRDRTEGYVHSVAVHRKYRHRGIARALLRQAFLGFHRQGRRTCALWTHSGTGALTLYQRIGMTVRQRSTHYSKALTST